MSLLQAAQEQVSKGTKPTNVKIVRDGFKYTFLTENSKGPCMRKTHIVSGKTTLVQL
jgi:hypothetical protein